jgi:hypothetical protein
MLPRGLMKRRTALSGGVFLHKNGMPIVKHPSEKRLATLVRTFFVW